MIAEEVLVEIDHDTICPFGTFFREIWIIAAPQVGEVRAGKDQFAWLECFDAVADKARTGAFQYYEKLVFRMGMPYGVEVFFLQAAYYKNL